MRGFVRHGPRMRSRHIPRKVHQYVHGWRRSKSKFPKLSSTSKGVLKTRLCHAFPFFFFSFSLPTQQVPERRACIDGNFPCVVLRCGCFAKSRCARGQARYIDSVFTVSSIVFLFFPFPFFSGLWTCWLFVLFWHAVFRCHSSNGVRTPAALQSAQMMETWSLQSTEPESKSATGLVTLIL